MESVMPGREVRWKGSHPSRNTVSATADFGGGKTCAVDRTTHIGLTAYTIRWRIVCGDAIVAVDRPKLLTYDLYSGELSVEVIWDSHRSDVMDRRPQLGRIQFGSGTMFRFESDSPAAMLLQTAAGAAILRHSIPWRDRDVDRGVQWVTALGGAELPWPEGGIATGLLCVLRKWTDELESDDIYLQGGPDWRRAFGV